MRVRTRLALGAALPTLALALGMFAAPPAGAVWPGANGKIVFFKFAFTSPTTFTGQIFSINRSGIGQTNLSAAGGGALQVDVQPSVSPDGRKIAFVRFDPSTGSAQLWAMNFDGSGQTDISNDAASFSESGPAWTPDGSKLLFVQQPSGSFPGAFPPGAQAGGSIWIRNADGSGTPTQLTAGPNDANPAMSPNGRMIAFSRLEAGGRHLFVMNSDGTGLTDYGLGSKPDWSPRGTKIVYGHAGSGPIMVVNVGDPSSAHVLVANPPTRAYEAPVWSPDGSRIAFQDCSADGLCQIAVMSATGQNPHDITNDLISDQKPDWQALTQNNQGQDNNNQ